MEYLPQTKAVHLLYPHPIQFIMTHETGGFGNCVWDIARPFAKSGACLPAEGSVLFPLSKVSKLALETYCVLLIFPLVHICI